MSGILDCTNRERALWDPTKAAWIGFFVFPPIGIIVHALNWKALGINRRVLINWIWLAGYGVYVVVIICIKCFEFDRMQVPALITNILFSECWWKFEAERQIVFFSRCGLESQCARSFLIPVVSGILGYVVESQFFNVLNSLTEWP